MNFDSVMVLMCCEVIGDVQVGVVVCFGDVDLLVVYVCCEYQYVVGVIVFEEVEEFGVVMVNWCWQVCFVMFGGLQLYVI